MNKLELKHWCSYIPYKPQVIFDNKIKGVLCGIRPNLLTELIVIERMDEDDIITKNWCADDTKLILHPLSDSTKEIEINGERFVPLIKIDVNNIREVIGDFIINKNGYSFHPIDLPYSKVIKLLEWHFDIYGLINKGLAIDINTLNQ